MIKRENYIKKIRPFYDNELIKVITGVRRSGKSVILKQIMEELKEKTKEDHIIYINMELYENFSLINNDIFYKFVKEKISDEKKYYLLVDEVQNIKSWEKAINSFNVEFNISIFLTGSNSNLLSGELATHIAGRYVAFKVLPFSFKEVLEIKNITVKEKIKEEFDDYLKWGGFPQKYTFNGSKDELITYLDSVYDSIVLKDIMGRNNLTNYNLLNLLINYFISTPSQTFSSKSISEYFESMQRNFSMETIYNYYEYIINSFILDKVPRYDIRGKVLLARMDKYYVADMGLTSVKNLNKKVELGAYLENIVYHELIRRNYTVYVGKVNDKEIDFIAFKGTEKKYFQVAYVLADQKIIDREFGNYDYVNDNHEKYVISTDEYDFSQNGIIHKNIITWLLEDSE